MVAIAAEMRNDAKVIGLISVAHFFSHFYMLVLPPLFPVLKDTYGASYAALGLLLTVSNVTTGLFQPPVGVLVDRIGGRLVLIGGLALHALAILLIGLSSTYAATLMLMGLAGLANAVYHPADYSILNASIDRQRLGRAFSIHTFSGYLGFAAAPATVAMLTLPLGWRGAVVATGIAGLVVAAVLMWQRQVLAEERAGKAGKSGAGLGMDLLRSPAILLAFLFFVLIAAAGNGVNSFSVAALGIAYVTPLWTATTGLSAYLFAGAAGVLVGGLVADRTERHGTVASICLAATATLFVLVATVDLGSAALIAVMTLSGLLNGVIQPARDMMVRAVTPPGAMGRVFGFVSSGFNVGGAIAPLGYGVLLDQGNAAAIFWVIAAFNLIAIVTVISVRWRR